MNDETLNVLVPTVGRPSSPRVFDVADALLTRYHGQATVLSVVEVAPDRSLSEGALLARRRRDLLRKIAARHPGGEFRAEVRTAYTTEEGIRAALAENATDLMLFDWQPARRARPGGAFETFLTDPPCDVAAVKGGKSEEVQSVLLPVRGGPHARLALKIAEAVAAAHGATLTLLHIDVLGSEGWKRDLADELFEAVRALVRYDRVQDVRLQAESVETTLQEEAARHDVVVMGAAARDVLSSYLLGAVPSRLAERTPATVITVKTREPVTASTFGLPEPPAHTAEKPDISLLVDRWFAENTFHSHEFRNIRHLVDLKERQGRTVSLVLPTLNEEATVGAIVSTIKKNLVDRYPLIDELLVIDSDSEDRTVEIVESLGVRVVKHPDILPQYGSYRGKGEALWKSLQVTTGDIVAWVDSDITGFHPKFVYGLVGPLLTQPELGFVKGFYRRPLNLGGELFTTGGGRVTELTARPLINLFYPQLSGLVQPLAGEMAGRRDVLQSVPFFTGYGVETGLLIDILERFGLRAIAQTDLENRIHRNQSLLSLSKMAFAIIQVVIKRQGEGRRLDLVDEVNTSMKLIHYSPTELFLELKEIKEHERPPIESLPEYVSSRSQEASPQELPVLAGSVTEE